ncbi:MAG: tRNA threonylcarbamoyladenosine dehydratase, partial [Gammaproteobacteria bacterium]
AQLVIEAQKHGVPVISAMGAGNRLDVSKARIAQLDKTVGCPLAREMRRRLRALQGNLKYPVIFSDEPRRPPQVNNISSEHYREKATNGTISYLPAVFGVLLAGEIVRALLVEINTGAN